MRTGVGGEGADEIATTEVVGLSGGDLESLRPEWTAVERDADAGPYRSFDWLASWATIYRPDRLRVLRMTGANGRLLAIGLLEQLPLGRLRFAGEPVTPIRGPLARSGYEAASWSTLERWLEDGHRSHWIGGQGVSAAAAPRRAVSTSEPWFGIELPDTFDTYLAQRPGDRRREMRRRMRVAEGDGAAVVVVTSELTRPLELFAAFHTRRASAKGEVHEAIDERLVMMLDRISQVRPDLLRLFMLERRREVVAVAVNLEVGDCSWAYNTGFSLDHARISPGLVLRLGSIRDAIERGTSRFDLGPGRFQYKRELGATEYERLRVDLSSSAIAGRGFRALSLTRRRLREVDWIRTLAGRVRSAGGGRL